LNPGSEIKIKLPPIDEEKVRANRATVGKPLALYL
jgi:hypothetical protein